MGGIAGGKLGRLDGGTWDDGSKKPPPRPAGMDMGIVNSKEMLAVEGLDPGLRQVCEELVSAPLSTTIESPPCGSPLRVCVGAHVCVCVKLDVRS